MPELVGILLAEVAGFSRMNVADQVRAQAALERATASVLADLGLGAKQEEVEFAAHGGSIWVVFLKCVPRVLEFAVAWTAKYHSVTALPAEAVLPRLAIHAGPAAAPGGLVDVLRMVGPALTVAQTLAAIGRPGDVLISKECYDLVLAPSDRTLESLVKPAGSYLANDDCELGVYYYYDGRNGNPGPPEQRRIKDEHGVRIRRITFPAILPPRQFASGSLDPTGARVVALGAHANDLAWGATGLLLKLVHEHSAFVHCHFITSNTWGQYVGLSEYGPYSRAFDAVAWVAGLYLGPARTSELIRDARKMDESSAARSLLQHVNRLAGTEQLMHVDGALPIDVGLPAPPRAGFQDGHISSNFDVLLERLEWLRRHFQPDLVLVPSSSDNHSDHRSIGEAALQIFKAGETLLHYHLPHADMPGRSFRPSIFIDLNNRLECPWNSSAKTTGELKLELFEKTMSNDRQRWRMSAAALAAFMVTFSVRGMCRHPEASEEIEASQRAYIEPFEAVMHLA